MLKKILLVLAALVVAFVVVGWLLPGDYRVERSLVIAAPPARVLEQAADLESWPEWSAWTRAADPECAWEFAGTGVGARMHWDGPELGEGSLTLTQIDPSRGLLYDLAFEHGEFLARGGLTLAPDGDRTRVTMWSEGELGSNPIHRWFGLAMDGMVGGQFETGLAGLKRRLDASG
jgi:hypothetical protein